MADEPTNSKPIDLILQIKGLLPVLAAVAAIVGFYYTTEHRLTRLEDDLSEMRERVTELQGEVSTVRSDINKVEKRYRRNRDED